MKQAEVASACHISTRQYQRMESGEQKPNFDCLVCLADLYQVSLDYLAGRTTVREIAKESTN